MKSMKYLFFVLVSFSSLGIELDQMPIPPSHEKTRSFTLLHVERQPEIPTFLKEKVIAIERKSRSLWTSEDSLTYAFELVYRNDFTHALNYFSRVQTDTIKHKVSLHLLQLTYLKTKRFDMLKSSILTSPDSPTVKEIRIRLVEVRELQENRTWDQKENVIFPILKDTSNYEYKSSTQQFHKYLVPRAEDFKKALMYDATYTDDTDIILSQAFEEYGDFLHNHFYLTNAFMAYSISRFYNKRNSSTSTKLKDIKRAMDKANYLQPSIRENFSKVSSDRYAFKTIAEKPQDSLAGYKSTSLSLEDIAELDKKKQPDYLPWINYEVLLLIVLFIILLVITIFVRTKK